MNFYEMNEAINVSYTAIVLDEPSRTLLLSNIPTPRSWDKVAHHMTINMGSAEKGPAANMIGQKANMQVYSFAQDNLVLAVGVNTNVPSNNKIKHITVAVNRAEGGKPFLSNKLTSWTNIESPFNLEGVIAECDQNGQIIS